MHRLTCYRCGRTVDDPTAARCTCGEPLWFAAADADFEWPAPGPISLWRYADLLPVGPIDGVATAAGGTPLVRTPRLDIDGCRLHVKDETENPTGSFKDRGSAVGVAAAVEAGVDRIGTVSHGNMAMSTAAMAAGHGLGCVVLVPTDISAERLTHIARYGPRIVKVDGPYGRLYAETLSLDTDIRFVNSDVPYRVAGQKTTALEICEAFAPDAPDAIVLPVSSGGHLSGLWKALRELRTAGLLETLPRLYAVQSEARAPIARAYERDADVVTPVEPRDTIAYSIGNVDPPSGNRVLSAVRETGGSAIAVDDEALRAAQQALARRAGFTVEASSAVALAGARALRRAGAIRADEDVVIVATGTGFKEADGPVDVSAETIALEELASVL